MREVIIKKSYSESSRSFVSPNFSDKTSWFCDATVVTDEIATTSDDTIYDFATSKDVIDFDAITDREDYPDRELKVKKNDVEITTGFTVDYQTNKITFGSANQGSDVIKVTYAYANSSCFELTASAGKYIELSYVETQFSEGTTINDYLIFELILNNATTSDTNVVAGKTEYRTAKDYLNKGNHGTILNPFGELTKKVNVFPWNYMTGFTIKPIGEEVNPAENEFNKIKMYLKNDTPYTNCEIGTATFYCLIRDL